MATKAVKISPIVALASNVSDAIVGIDRDNRITLFNPVAEQSMCLDAGEVLGSRPGERPETEWIESLLERAAQANTPVFEEATRLSGTIYRARVIAAGAKDRFVVLNPVSKSDGLNGQLAGLMSEVVHSLKTPIAAVKSSIELAEQFGPLTESQLEFTQRAQRKLEYMIDLVHELLDMAWLGSGQSLALNRVDLNDLAQRAVSEFGSHVERQNSVIDLDLPPDGCFVECDERRIVSAIGNLVSNAIKYSPQDPRIRVVIHLQDEVATLRVEDNGLGIAPEHLPQLFEWFYRVRTDETWRIEGSGLGLAIVKAVIEKHSGQVFVESTPGQGSVFGFTLPATQCPTGGDD